MKHVLPEWNKKFSPDIVVANIENIAHGKGIGETQIKELKAAGVDIFTGGNHSIEGKDAGKILADETIPILRPANMSPGIAGRGALFYKNILAINLIGQVHMKQSYDSPFRAADKILEENKNETPFKIVDWHSEATSEKSVMGWYLDGKVSAVFGTHTHVPTADAKILPKGTAFISDIGMVGPYNSIIGVDIETSLTRFKNQITTPMNVVESGPIEVNAIFLELGGNGKAVDIKHLREIIEEYRM